MGTRAKRAIGWRMALGTLLSSLLVAAGGLGAFERWTEVNSRVTAHALVLGGAVGLITFLFDLRAHRFAAPTGPGNTLLARLLTLALLTLFLATRPGTDELVERGDVIKQRIEAYRQSSGELPRSLDELSLDNPLTRYGRWSYRLNADRSGYALDFGDYSRDGFAIYMSAEAGRIVLGG